MIRKLQRFWSMNTPDRWMLIEALALPCGIWLAFRLAGVPRTQALLRNWAGEVKGNPLPPAERESLIRSARRAQRIVRQVTHLGGNCLVRSLTLWAILARRGVPTDLRVGFRKRNGRIEGHAWLDHEGSPVNESVVEAHTYVPYDQPVTFDLWRQIRQS